MIPGFVSKHKWDPCPGPRSPACLGQMCHRHSMTPACTATAGTSFPSDGNLNAQERKELWQPPPGPWMNHQDNMILDCAGAHVPENKSKVREFSSSFLNPSGVLLVSDSFQLFKAYKGADWGVMAGSQPVGNCLAREWYSLSSSSWFSMTMGNQKENNL